MREKEVESALVKGVRERYGMAFKFNSMGCDGVPDRLVLLPGGHVGFIELKAPGKHMRPLQKKRKRQIEVLGFKVFCLDGKDQIGEVLDEIQSA